jgi:hypothetical protein
MEECHWGGQGWNSAVEPEEEEYVGLIKLMGDM